MKATRINAKQAQELINDVKSVIRLGGFETGLRTNLNKAIRFCKGICGVDRNGNNVTFTPIESTKRGISFGKSYKINANNTL
jgi:hypothetical protein